MIRAKRSPERHKFEPNEIYFPSRDFLGNWVLVPTAREAEWDNWIDQLGKQNEAEIDWEVPEYAVPLNDGVEGIRFTGVTKRW